jgi:hypothetical protein
MASKKLDIEIGGESAIRVLDMLEAKAAALQNTLQGLASTLGTGTSGPSDRAQFFGTLEQLGSVQGAINAARSSVTAGTNITRENLMGAAAGGSAAFGTAVRNKMVADPQGIFNQAQGAGVSGSALGAVVQQLADGRVPYIPGSASSSAVVAQVVQSVQSAQNNPFALMPQGGSSSPIGNFSGVGNPAVARYFAGPGGQFDAGNAAYMARLNQPAPGANYMAQAGAGIAIGAASAFAGNTLDYRSNQILNGGGSVMDRARAGFSAGGALIGAGLGAFAGPPGMAIGAAIVGNLSGSLGSYLAAPMQNAVNTMTAQMPLAVAAGFTLNERSPAGVSPRWRQGRFSSLSEELNQKLFGNGPGNISSSQIAGAWSAISDGMVAGGSNPFQKASSGYVYGASPDAVAAAEHRAHAPGGAGLNAMNSAAEVLVRQYGFGKEQTGEMYTRRLSRLFGGYGDGDALKEASKTVGSIFATLPETGGNPADVLKQFGPSKTALFMRIQNEDLKSQVSLKELSRVSALTRGAQRDASIGSLQARGSGAASEAAYRREMAAYATLPGGDKSMVYAEVAAKARSAGQTAFEQAGVGAFGIPMAHLAGERERLAVLPFSPGNRFANDLRTIALDNKEIKRVGSYMAQRRKSGQLSEDEELSLTQRLEGLETSKAYGIASLSSGMENRLPALSAGKGRRFDMFNSTQLASLALYKIHSPIRDFGSINGQQKQEQDEFLNGFHVRQTGPRSRTQGINNASSSDRVETLLERIANALERGGSQVGRASRPGEIAGAAAGALAQRNVGNGLNGKAN